MIDGVAACIMRFHRRSVRRKLSSGCRATTPNLLFPRVPASNSISDLFSGEPRNAFAGWTGATPDFCSVCPLWTARGALEQQPCSLNDFSWKKEGIQPSLISSVNALSSPVTPIHDSRVGVPQLRRGLRVNRVPMDPRAPPVAQRDIVPLARHDTPIT